MSGELERVRVAAGRLQEARREYRAAFLAAVYAGESFAALGRATGMSRQGARELAGRLESTSRKER